MMRLVERAEPSIFLTSYAKVFGLMHWVAFLGYGVGVIVAVNGALSRDVRRWGICPIAPLITQPIPRIALAKLEHHAGYAPLNGKGASRRTESPPTGSAGRSRATIGGSCKDLPFLHTPWSLADGLRPRSMRHQMR